MRGLLHLVRISLRRDLASRKTAVTAAVLILLAALVIAVGLIRPWSPRSYGRFIALNLFQLFFVPMAALAYGTGALGGEREGKTLVYLLARPLSRGGIYLAKAAASVPLVLGFGLGGMALLGGIAAGSGGRPLSAYLEPYWEGVLWSGLAYLALFHFLAAAFRRSAVIAIAYVFFVEVFIGRIPGILSASPSSTMPAAWPSTGGSRWGSRRGDGSSGSISPSRATRPAGSSSASPPSSWWPGPGSSPGRSTWRPERVGRRGELRLRRARRGRG